MPDIKSSQDLAPFILRIMLLNDRPHLDSTVEKLRLRRVKPQSHWAPEPGSAGSYSSKSSRSAPSHPPARLAQTRASSTWEHAELSITHSVKQRAINTQMLLLINATFCNNACKPFLDQFK